ncbi:MAG: TolC family protein [Marinicaulis sp.]|nr:TolC family protein [Marinicaulis sp.]
MRKRNIGFFFGAAGFIFAVAQPQSAIAETNSAGSLYPADTRQPTQASARKDEMGASEAAPVILRSGVVDNPALAKALGPAAYILDNIGVSNDFNSAIRLAVGRHPAYHSQLTGLDGARAERRRAKAALYPQLSTLFRGDYSLTRSFDPNTDNVVESLRPREQFTVGLSASQLVYDGGATFQRIKSARARDSEFRNSISARINELSLAALAAYHDFATHQALVALGDAFILRHEKILNDVKERERLGASSKADVSRALARLAAAQARVFEIRESKQFAEIRYQEFFTSEPGLLRRPSFVAVSVDTRSQAMALATGRSPEVAISAARRTASQADYKAAKGARLPEVRVSVDAVKFDVFDSGNDFDVRAGLVVNYNIFGGGARAADIAQARARARQNQFTEEQTREAVARDAAIAFERSVGAAARLQALETAVIAHNQTRDLILERYRVSRGDLIDVLQTENDYFEAGMAYLTGLANRDMAVYGLMEHTGDLLRFFSPQEEFANAVAWADDADSKDGAGNE